MANPSRVISGRIVFPVANQALQFPFNPIPDGKKVLVKGYRLNVGDVYVAYSVGVAQNIESSFSLGPAETAEYEIDNTSRLYASAQFALDIVLWTAEVEA